MRQLPRELTSGSFDLAAAIEQFERSVSTAAAKPAVRRRMAMRPLPNRPAPVHRPTRHPVALPVRYRRNAAPTVLGRIRARQERRRGGPTGVVAAVRRAGGRVTAAVRRSLGALRNGLRRLGGRGRGDR